MSVSVVYKAQIKRLAGVSEETVAAQKELNDLLQSLCEGKSDEFANLLFKENSRSPNLLIFLNKMQVSLGSNPLVSEGDSLLLMSPISGG